MKMFNLGNAMAQDYRGDKGSYCTLLKARRLNFDKYWGKEGVVPQLQNHTFPKLIFARVFPSTEGSFPEDWLNLYTLGFTKLSKLGLQRYRLGHARTKSGKSDAKNRASISH